MKRKLPIRIGIIVLSLFCGIWVATSCVPVKEYQKVRLNDKDMELGNRALEEFELNFQSYREGAVGGNNGNSGAGCGCN